MNDRYFLDQRDRVWAPGSQRDVEPWYLLEQLRSIQRTQLRHERFLESLGLDDDWS